MDIFIQQLKKAMFVKGWRQIDLVRATGYTDGQISSWYNGRYRPNAEAMAKIAKALGVTVAYLVGEEDIPVSKLAPIDDDDIIGQIITDDNGMFRRLVKYYKDLDLRGKEHLLAIAEADAKYARHTAQAARGEVLDVSAHNLPTEEGEGQNEGC